jgi:hypothetical protein
LRLSRHIFFAVISPFAFLLPAGCGDDGGPGGPPDAGQEAPPDASGGLDAAPPADAAAPADAPGNGAPDATPGPPVGTCVPSEAIAPPGSGECVLPGGMGVYAEPHIDEWYDGKFIAEASCSILGIDSNPRSYFRIEMDCIQSAGDPFDASRPLLIDIRSETRVLPPRLLAGERFALRIARNHFDSGDSGPNITWLTMRDEDDGALLFALNTRSPVPDQVLLDRLSLTAGEWLAPIVVDTVTGVCPTVPDDDGTAERIALDITVPGQEPVRLVDRHTAYLGDTYFLELGTFAHFSSPEVGERPFEALMLAAVDVCAE